MARLDSFDTAQAQAFIAKEKPDVRIRFRIATVDDVALFHDKILNDPVSARKLGISGVEGDVFDGNRAKMTIIAETCGSDPVPVGFVKVIGNTSSGWNYMEILYVVDGYRKQHVASRLFNFMEKYARANWNAYGMDCFTIENIEMEQFLEKHGFMVVSKDDYAYFINGHRYTQKRWVKLYADFPEA